MEFTKRQYTEIKKRNNTIWNELTHNKESVLHSLGIDYKERCIYYSLKSNKYRELIFGYFWDYNSCKRLQNNIIKIAKTIDIIMEADYTSIKEAI